MRSSTIEIIGVVADALYEGPREGVHRQVFVPNWGKNSAVFYVRAHTASSSAFNLIRNEVRQLDATHAGLPDENGRGAARSNAADRATRSRCCPPASALLATMLPSIGLYGVMAFVVARRRKELGIRLALGAQPRFVIWLVMREVLCCSRLASPSASRPRWRWAATSRCALSDQAERSVDGHVDDGVARIVSASAGLIPAHRASRIDPILALRTE